MFFSLIKEINRLLKEINRLVSKGMSNIYFKVAIEIKVMYSILQFSKLKSSSPGQFFGGAPSHADIKFSKFLLQLISQRSGSKIVCGFSIILRLKGIMMFKVKEYMLFVEQKYKL